MVAMGTEMFCTIFQNRGFYADVEEAHSSSELSKLDLVIFSYAPAGSGSGYSHPMG